jgi:hypothetical protein
MVLSTSGMIFPSHHVDRWRFVKMAFVHRLPNGADKLAPFNLAKRIE